MSVLIIAEPGGTAEGDFGTMLRTLEAAHVAGANVWKPQFTTDAERHLARRSARLSAVDRAAFQLRYRRAYRWLQWPTWWHADFRDRCHALGMAYACSVCLPEDVAVAAPFLDYLKISSFEADDPGLFTEAYLAGPTVIVSLNGSCVRRPSLRSVKYLHCVSSYPAPLEELNLAAIRASRLDGFSDHSGLIETGALAVAAGAEILEVHMKLPDTDPANPDAGEFALLPDALGDYIAFARQAERMLGSGEKRLMPSEEPMARYQVRA